MNHTLRLLFVLAAVLPAIACGSGLPADLTVAIDGEPQSLDPALITGVSEGRIAAALFEGLTRLDPATLEPVPAAAESFLVSADGRTWTFTLAGNLHWSDGRPLTAEDFRWSWLRLLAPETGAAYAGLLFDVEGAREYQAGKGPRQAVGIRAPDDRTLSVRLVRPVPYFPSLTSFFTLLPVPRHAVELDGEGWTRAGRIVSNGPFVLEDWRFYREILLARNPRYRDADRVRIGRIRLIPVPSENTQLNLYLTGGADIVFSVPATAVPKLRRRNDFRSGPRLATMFLRLNVTRPPFDDGRIRRALARAVDRKAIVTRIVRGGEPIARSLVPPVLPDYDPPEGPAEDVEAAQRLMADSGHPAGKGLGPVSLLFPARPREAAIATVLQHDLRERLGLDVRLDPREWKVYIAAMRRLEFDLALGQWIGDYPDASTFLNCFLSDSGNNRTGFKSERYDSLIADAETLRPGESPADHVRRRARTFAEAESFLLRDAAPIVTLYHPVVTALVSPRVRGFTPNVMGLVSFRDLSVEAPR